MILILYFQKVVHQVEDVSGDFIFTFFPLAITKLMLHFSTVGVQVYVMAFCLVLSNLLTKALYPFKNSSLNSSITVTKV